MALLIGAAMLSPVEAKTLNSPDQISSHAIYNLTRQATVANGGGLLHSTSDSEFIMSTRNGYGISADEDAARWSIHYSQREKAYFLYNIGSGTFASGDERNRAILSPVPVEARFTYHSNPKGWLIDCGGALLGLDRDNKGIALFTDDIDRSAAREMTCYYTVTAIDDEILSQGLYNEIENKIIEGRAQALAKYTEFLTKAQQMAASVNKNNAAFIGLYDIDELKYAVEHADDYTLNEIEDIYQKTLLGRMPKAGTFYRLHFQERPSRSYYKNVLRSREDGSLVSTEFRDFAFGSATDGFSDDLCLFRFWPVNGDATRVKIEVAAFGDFLTAVGNNQVPGRTSTPSEAEVYTISNRTNTQRTYILEQSCGNIWLTVSGSMDLTSWNDKESSMYFYLEPVNTISVPVDANGYASVCLPCGVKVPENCKAYTVTSVENGQAFVEEITGFIHENTPWILKADAGVTSVDVPVENNTSWIKTEMTGNVRVNANTPGRYVPEYSASGISFKYVAATEPAEKTLPGSIYIVSEDNGPLTTVMGANPNAAIEEITVDDASARELFDLQGRRVIDTPRPGLYINAATKRVVRVK